MKKNKIRLTESQLRGIIRDVLNEESILNYMKRLRNKDSLPTVDNMDINWPDNIHNVNTNFTGYNEPDYHHTADPNVEGDEDFDGYYNRNMYQVEFFDDKNKRIAIIQVPYVVLGHLRNENGDISKDDIVKVAYRRGTEAVDYKGRSKVEFPRLKEYNLDELRAQIYKID